MTVTVTKPCGRKVLYYCPSTMIGNVEREIRRWSPHRSVVVLGGQSKITRRFLLDMMKQHPEYVVIVNYEASRKDNSLVDDLIDTEFDTCIIDEAHNIKDRRSKGYRDIKKVLTESDIPFVIPMTGTPILNKPQEFFSLLTLVDPYHFNSESYFLRDFCSQDLYTKKWHFKPGGVELLFKQFPNLFMRRTKEQAGIVLPPVTVTVHEIEVDEHKYPMQASARNQMREYASIMLDPDQGKAIAAAAQIAVYTRLRQIETWPASIKVRDKDGDVIMELGDEYAESQKIDEIIGWENGDVNEWGGIFPEVTRHTTLNPDGERTVVFSQFKDPLHVIRDRAAKAGYTVAIYDGDTPESMRQEIQMDLDMKFKDTPGWGKYDAVLCNYRVGGAGLNFTSASQMIILDEEWNPGKRDQAYGRMDRMGQEKPMTVHVLRSKGAASGSGIDTWLAGIIEDKERLVDGFHGTADSMAQDAFDAIKNGLI